MATHCPAASPPEASRAYEDTKSERTCVIFLYDLCYYTSYVLGGHERMQSPERPRVFVCVFTTVETRENS